MTRRGPLRVREYLEHSVQAAVNITDYTAGMNQASYLQDRKTQDAVIRNLEVIGEACNNIRRHHPEFASTHSNILWGAAYEMRNALAHGYFKVDHEIVWRTIQRDLPALDAAVRAALASLAPSSD
jgi:uncharacterized protein with HEPN domain